MRVNNDTSFGSAPIGTSRPMLADPAAVANSLAVPRRRILHWSWSLPPGWPLSVLLIFYPLWWALGMPVVLYALIAIPMAVSLFRRPRISFPPAFMLWAVLLVWVALSGLMLGQVAPDTLPPSGSGRYFGFGIRVVNYLALTIIMLYVGNLSERELPKLRIVRLLSWMALVTVVGGWVGALAPGLHFDSPMEQILPKFISGYDFVQKLVHVEVAQVQDVFGGDSAQPRPSAPFEYTNTWGQNIGILLIWFVVGWALYGSLVRKIFAGVVIAAAIFPIVYSLNRGLWVGLGVAAVYVALRLAVRGRMAVLGGLLAVTGLLALTILATPFGALINERIAHGHSDDIRSTLNAAAVQAAVSSPVLGYGAGRALIGSNRSIAIGKSADCPQCGNRLIGSDGQVWLLLVSQGFVGAFCYLGFFAWLVWRYRHDHSPIGIAGSLTMLLMIFFSFFYGSLNSTLSYGLIAAALLWRNNTDPAPPPPMDEADGELADGAPGRLRADRRPGWRLTGDAWSERDHRPGPAGNRRSPLGAGQRGPAEPLSGAGTGAGAPGSVPGDEIWRNRQPPSRSHPVRRTAPRSWR